jgi:hypothetical protein
MGAYKRNSKGISQVLRSDRAAAAILDAAETMAATITAEHPDLEPGIHPGTTDRAVVTLAVAGGAGLQASDGLFTRAAASAGLEVKSR